MASKRVKSRPEVIAVLPAAGLGTRLKSRLPKPFVPMNGLPLVIHTVRALQRGYAFKRILMPVDKIQINRMRRLLVKHRVKCVEVMAGGEFRAQSVRNAVDCIESKDSIVLIHDLARPFVGRLEIKSLIELACKRKTALLAEKAKATVKYTNASGACVEKTLNRERIYLAQTPQVFQLSVLNKAYAAVGGDYKTHTDEASIVEVSGQKVYIMPGPSSNFKITTPEDLALAKQMLRK